MIEVRNLVKRYGNHLAVDGLSFSVEKGQIYGFLGPNGAGKSTTMNIITGYIASTQGSVSINGHDILEEPQEAKKCIGYLPEQPPLYMEMTVYEYLAFVAELKKIPKKERGGMIRDIMEMTKTGDVKNRLIKNLSKGYRQRVGLAQAIMGYPEVIILDEPTVGLDPKQIIEIRELIKSLGKKHTVILSSHILSEVSAVCDYVMIIAHGRLVASDTPENLSRLMQGGDALKLRVRASRDDVQEILKRMPDVVEWEFTKADEDAAVDLEVRAAEGADIREELFYEMARARCPILMMNTTKISLEDVFLELTADGPGEKDGRSGGNADAAEEAIETGRDRRETEWDDESEQSMTEAGQDRQESKWDDESEQSMTEAGQDRQESKWDDESEQSMTEAEQDRQESKWDAESEQSMTEAGQDRQESKWDAESERSMTEAGQDRQETEEDIEVDRASEDKEDDYDGDL